MFSNFSLLFLPYNKIPLLSFPSPPNPGRKKQSTQEVRKISRGWHLHSPLSLLEATE